MTINGNYAHPIYVNGYPCNNCTDVANAKRHIDPAHPKSGPFDINAATDPTRHHDLGRARHDKPGVIFGGTLSALNGAAGGNASGPAAQDTSAPGSLLDISA